MKKFLGFVLIISAIAVYMAYTIVFSNQIKDESVEIKIRKGNTWSDVQHQIKESNSIKNPLLLDIMARVLKYDQNIKPGRYVLKNGNTTFDIIRKLRSGNQDAVNFVINNITFPEQLASRVAQKLDIDSTEFLQYITDPTIASQYGFTKDNFWSMFICNTYQLYWNIGLEGLIERMNAEYNKFWTEERRSLAYKRGLLPEEAITIASIVQKETTYKPEYGKVASVYLNRLRIGMPLQADPTIKFALKDMSIKRIIKDYLHTDSPYNTYKYNGLPPGPIGLPETNVILGVINAPSSDYLYFCAIFGSGKHDFSTNYQDHMVKARAYQRALNENKIFR